MRGHFLRASLAGAVGGGGGYDTDAQTWFTAVEAADADTLEAGVKDAADDFITGCKTDGSWSKITQLFLMAGPRTKAGASVPVVGDAFVGEPGAGNPIGHSRTDGLFNDGSNSRRIQLGVTTDDFAQNDHHMALFMANGGTSNNLLRPWLGTTSSEAGGSSRLSANGNTTSLNNRSWGADSANATLNPRVNFFIGVSRTASDAWVSIRHTTVQALTTASTAIGSPASFYLFGNAGTNNASNSARARLLVMGTGMSQADFEQLRTRCVAYSDAIVALSLG